MNRFLVLFFFGSLFISCLYSQSEAPLKGRVVDASTGSGLAGANIILDNSMTGIAADSAGYFELIIPQNTFSIIVSFIGYINDTIKIPSKKEQFIEIRMIPDQLMVEQVELIGNSRKHIEDVSQGETRIKGRDIEQIPTFMGEKDPIKALRLTPGVQGSKEGFNGLYIRGGGPDQNLIQFDGTTIYNPSHLYGFFSVFNPDITDEVTLLKSGMDAEYGGRISSVLKVDTRDGDFEKFNVKSSLGLLSSKLTIDGPVQKNKTSFILSGRRTYIHEMLNMLKEPLKISDKTLKYTNYHFYDLNFKVSSKINNRNKLEISFYKGGDNFNFEGESFGFSTHMDWENIASSMNWNHYFNSNFYMKNSLSFSGYKYNFDGQFLDYYLFLSSYIQDYGFKNCFYVNRGNSLIKYGIEAHQYKLKPSEQTLEHIDFRNELVSIDIFHSFEISPFISYSLDMERLKTNFGLRLSNYFQTGPLYEWTKTIDATWEGELLHTKNDIVKYYPGFNPRISSSYLINSFSSVKLSFTTHNQYVHIAPVSTVSLPTDIWVPSTKNIEPQKGWQVSSGYYADIFKDMLEVSIDFYYKRMDNQIEMGNNVVDLHNVSFEQRLLFGKGTSKGMEIFTRKKSGNLSGWIGYTLSYSERQFDQINSGKTFYAKYDRRHDLSCVGMYQFNQKWSGSLVFVYATGNAFTVPKYRYLIQGKIVNGYPSINSFRMPAYHRADLSITRNIKGRRLNGNINFSIYNLYNHKNPYYIIFNTMGSVEENRLEVKPEMVSLFTILPSLSIQIFL